MTSIETLNKLLYEYIDNPEDAEINFLLGIQYHNIKQTAAAVSYYLRAAERADDDLLKYECMIRASMCFEIQGMRGISVKGILQHAITILPKRPEAYFYLSRFYERTFQWQDSYLIASIGEKVCDFTGKPLRTKIDYPGAYGIIFEKAVSSWQCGLCDESRILFKMLIENYELDDIHLIAVLNNIKNINVNTNIKTDWFTTYNKLKYPELKIKFKDSELIEKNFSEAYQDMFVLTMLNGKHNGTYLEIGAGNAFYGNNTALLETQFNWEGISIDYNLDLVKDFKQKRHNYISDEDALKFDYNNRLVFWVEDDICDYLQLDIDPPQITYEALLKIPFDKIKFRVITYEHDYYADQNAPYRQLSRDYLKQQGYTLVVNDIAPDDTRNYEDWWIHPDLIDKDILTKMICINENTKKAQKYMFGMYKSNI